VTSDRSESAPPVLSRELRAYLADPTLDALWHAVRARLRKNGCVATGKVNVKLDDAGAEHFAGLLGSRTSPRRGDVDLAVLDAALRDSAARRGLVEVLAALGLPVEDRKAQLAAEEAERARLADHLVVTLARHGLRDAPWAPAWRSWARRSGTLSRAGKAAGTVVEHAVTVLARLAPGGCLPVADDALGVAPPVLELAELASTCCGDAHALDDGKAVGALVLGALALAAREERPATAAERRALWLRAGVAPDDVSGTVLVWGLRPAGTHPWSRMMRARADLGVVTHVTMMEWRAAPATTTWTDPAQRVFVCENPQVVQAAARARVTGTLLCTAGNPALVALRMIDALVAAGADVGYHGDFDVAGVAMAARLFARGVRPWRFGAEDYLAALGPVDELVRLPLTGPVPATPWDPRLAEEMTAHGAAVHEEAQLSQLFEDMRA
jgi:uncharacterized protein (TIGR02679 family)